MNRVTLIGNLTKDPEVRSSTGNNPTTICTFTLAVNDRKKNPQGEWVDDPSFIPIVVFGKQGDNCGRYLAKGRQVAIEGKIKTGSYEKNGQRVYTTEVVATGVEFLKQANNPPQEPVQQSLPAGFEEVRGEQLPF